MFVIDFEASGLEANSYPIQVAVYNGKDSYDAYIRPADDWTHWNIDSQNIHNIPRTLLIDVGKPIKQVANDLNEFIGDITVYCDGGIYDIGWANALYESAQIKRSWLIGDVVSHAMRGQERSVLRATGKHWFQLKRDIGEQYNMREHDALNDAKIIRQAAIQLQNAY